MKKTKTKTNKNGNISAQALVAKAATAKQLVKAARKHLESLKAEHKQARKAVKLARKAAKRARKEAKQAIKLYRKRYGVELPKIKLSPPRRPMLANKQAIARKKPARTTVTNGVHAVIAQPVEAIAAAS